METLNRIKNKIGSEKIIRFFGCFNPVWLLIFLSLIFFGWAGLFFYQYIFKTPTAAPSEQIKIDTELYNQVMENLKARQTNIQEGIAKSYPDMFR